MNNNEKEKDSHMSQRAVTTEKLTKRFVGSYRVKSIVLTNAIELKLPSCYKIAGKLDNPRQ